jgi:DNA-binding Lrp family transcriptional regulator
MARGRAGPAPSEPPRSLDFAILCERYRYRPGGFGFDPRKSPEVIANRLNVSPATVRRRFTEWRKDGFFLGYDVVPHPELLGGRLMARLLEFRDPIAQERAVRPLSLIDGVVRLVPSRNTFMVVYLLESPAQSERRLQQLRAIEGTLAISPEMPFPFPPCGRRMSRSDWELVRALRREPEAGIAGLADMVGQSPRTTSRRLDALLEAGAVLFDPTLDYSRFSENLAVVVAFLTDAASAEPVETGIRALFPQSAQSWGPSPLAPDGAVESVQFMVCARTTAELDERAARVGHIPGVAETLLWYERSNVPVREWLDERIERVLDPSQTAR